IISFFFSSRRWHTRSKRDWSSDVCSSDLLETNEIAAAGLDVFEKEPVDPDNPLLKMNNVVTLPHIGSATYATELKMASLAYENLCKGLTNEMPITLVDKAMWDLRKK